ncbi:MAG: recombination mediator RecR [Desulfobacterales bacterium]|nr:recombination mediator RecR [Desulfobacterales bacterium]
MNHYPSSLKNLIKNFARLPGIGQKTAERLAMHVLRAPESEARQLAESLVALKGSIKLCTRCFALSDSDVCHICDDPARDATIVCVVEQPADMAAIEKSGAFKGCYHILQGVLSPMDGIGPDKIRISELVKRAKDGAVKEIILATSTSVEGEATASYLSNILEKHPVEVTRIASGVPIGGDLKYVDQVTLKRAMENRNAV